MYEQHFINFTTTIDTGYVQLHFYMPVNFNTILLQYKVDWQIVRPAYSTPGTITALDQFPWDSSGLASSDIVTLMIKSSPPRGIVANATVDFTTISWTWPENNGYDIYVSDPAPVVYYLLETREDGCTVTLERVRCDIHSVMCDFETRVFTLGPLKFETEFRMIAVTLVGDGEPSAWQRVEMPMSPVIDSTTVTRTCSYCGT